MSSSCHSQFQRCPFILFYHSYLSVNLCHNLCFGHICSSMHIFQILYVFLSYGKRGKRAGLLSIIRMCITTNICSGIAMFSKSFPYLFYYSTWYFWLLLSTGLPSDFSFQEQAFSLVLRIKVYMSTHKVQGLSPEFWCFSATFWIESLENLKSFSLRTSVNIFSATKPFLSDNRSQCNILTTYHHFRKFRVFLLITV